MQIVTNDVTYMENQIWIATETNVKPTNCLYIKKNVIEAK